MSIPLQTKLKIYITISISIQLIGLISVIILYLVYINLGNEVIDHKVFSELTKRIIFFLVIVFTLSFFYGSYVYFFVFKKGINRYRDLKKRLEQTIFLDDFNLTKVSFPEEDEFGNLGFYLNAIINKLIKIDELRKERLFVEYEKNKLLADFITIPILFVGMKDGAKIIRHYNNVFEKIFARKNEDSYYDVRNINLSNIIIRTTDSVMNYFNKMADSEIVDTFIDKEFENALDYVIAQKTKTTIKNKKIKTINGKETYLSEEINIYPILDSKGNPMEIVIFFGKFKKIK